MRERVSTPDRGGRVGRRPSRTCAARSSWRPATSVNVKLAGCGGFGPAREALREARAHGLDAFLSSTLDGPWGIAAALQLAAAEELTLACGLATLELFDARIARALPQAQRAPWKVPQGPGLGVRLDPAALDAVVVESLA